MYKKSPQGWLKHWDFILLDIFCLQLAFVVAYLVRQGLENPYSDQIYRTVAFVFMLCQIVVMFLGQSYQDILKRGYYIEFTKTAKHVLMVMLLSVLYLFATQQAVSYSRLTLFYTAFLYLCFDYVGRVWHKENVLKKNATKKKEKSMVVVVSLAEAKETIEKILSSPIQNFSINGIALIDDNPGVKEIVGIPVVGNMDTISEYLCHEWVDEVFVKISETEPYPQKLIDEIITMGLTVHLSLGEMEKSLSGKNFIEKIGGYSVITSSINTASPKQLLYKRLMDIAGGIVGCLLTVILIIVIGPMIYIKSPGPIFFSQVRIGKNGKKFKIYKFRSMYMDAEERKAELMSQNKMEGLMFKMDYDPRIIGSEKKDKNGNPKGIGNFIRKTSLDEFPQFWNVLKGDMSLVGTRPPTVDESQSIFVSDIKVNILDYKCAENLFAFTHSILCGGDGDVKDHVYHCVLDSDNQYKKMEYCGDHSLGDVYNDFSFDSSAEHVIIEGDEIGCFNFVFGYKNPGIYKFNYVVDYVANGKEHSIKSKKYEVYLPPISEVNDPGEFDMLDEIYKEEGKYLYDRIDNYYTHPIKLTRKMTEYLEVLRDAQ